MDPIDPLSLGVPGSMTRCRIAIIHSWLSSSMAVARFAGFRVKQRFKKSMPSALRWSSDGSCGGLPCAMLYMMAHSLSRFAQGRRPVAISRMTHPRLQMSPAPPWPGFSPLITSGDMYIGVPVIDLFCFVVLKSCTKVRLCRAMTLAAPKSTYLMTPLWSSRMSASVSLLSSPQAPEKGALTLWLNVAMGNVALVKIRKTLEKLQRVNHDDLLVLDAAMF